MERLPNPNTTKPHGITVTGLRTWGFAMLMLGLVGRGLIQNGMLHLSSQTGEGLLQAMNQSGEVMLLVTISLALAAVESCAAPIFAYLTVEGFQKTRSFRKYFLRVLLVALLTEIPYNLAVSGKFIDLETRNPVFGVLLSLALLYFYRFCGEKVLKNTIIKVIVSLAALIWGKMLGIEHGSFLAMLSAALWFMRGKPLFRPMVGCVTAVLGSVLSPLYVASPMGFLAIHFCNGEKGEENRLVNYLAYPVMVTITAVAAMLL